MRGGMWSDAGGAGTSGRRRGAAGESDMREAERATGATRTTDKCGWAGVRAGGGCWAGAERGEARRGLPNGGAGVKKDSTGLTLSRTFSSGLLVVAMRPSASKT